MNKVYVLPANESWIIDRFVHEFNEDNEDICTCNPERADVIWLLADFCWKKLPIQLLLHKKVITTINHIVPEKYGPTEQTDFKLRDQITTVYHVCNQRTYNFIRPLTKKPIKLIPYWCNQHIFECNMTKVFAREKHGLPHDAFIVFSAQRDTEGAGIAQNIFLPKLEKGSDLLADAIVKWRDTTHPNIHVLLAGWRRQYIITRLKNAYVPYSYIELPKHSDLCELYRCADLYPVTARYEGGPQSLIECGILNVPVVTTPVGIAEQVLPPSAIRDDVTQAAPCVPQVSNMLLPQAYEPYRDLVQSL